MKFAPIFSACLVLSLLVAAPLCGADKAAKKKKAKKDPTAAYFALPATITLSDEQKVKYEEVKKEFAEKAAKVQKEFDNVLTADQKKARHAAAKAARQAGKKGKELRQAVADAAQLTDEQKQNLPKATKEVQALKAQVREKFSEFLTAEQKEKLPKKGKNKV